jgi:glutathionyl-hydroquinone reductase
MALKAGTWEDTIFSEVLTMVGEMEKAFREDWPEVMNGAELPDKLDPQMKLVFAAVAKGVVRHLATNQNAFKISVDTSHDHTHNASVEIEAE